MSVGTNTSTETQTDWRSLVVQADPDWNRAMHWVVEYEFSSSGRRAGNPLTHRDGMRVFRGDPNTRGAYVAQTDPVTDALIWNGQPLVWNGQRLIWSS